MRSFSKPRQEEGRHIAAWHGDVLRVVLRCVIFATLLWLCISVALLLHIEPTSHSLLLTVAMGGVVVASWTSVQAEASMSQRGQRKNNSAGLSKRILALPVFVFWLLAYFVLTYSHRGSAMIDHSHLRDFLLDAKSWIAAIAALLGSIPPLIKTITNSRKEWRSMQPKTRLEGVKSTVRKGSVIFPLLLGLMLTGVGGAILVGRASVVQFGKAIGEVGTFSVDENYVPTGKMGDICDVSVSKQADFVRFVSQAKGQGPHEWEYKYTQERENPHPAQFGGVMYLDPSGNWGTDPDGGYDLRNCHRIIRWEARSADGEVNGELFIRSGNK